MGKKSKSNKSSEDGSDKKRPRARNFTPAEEELLVTLAEKHRTAIVSKFTNSITNISKQKTWALITKQINAIGGYNRSVATVKKKWEDMKRKTKQIIVKGRQQIRLTGGGEAEETEIYAFADRVANVMGKVACKGVPGSFDSGHMESGDLYSMNQRLTQSSTPDNDDEESMEEEEEEDLFQVNSTAGSAPGSPKPRRSAAPARQPRSPGSSRPTG